MSTFIEKPASSLSLRMRKKIYGVGINDAPYTTHSRDSQGVMRTCPYYQRWKNMLHRCYSPQYSIKHPTYKDCEVCEEWTTFSNFKEWMASQEWEGKQLDKDILVEGNSTYSPDNCVFISGSLNKLFTDNRAVRGDCPQGVHVDSSRGGFIAACNNGEGKTNRIGRFSCIKIAEAAYCNYKATIVDSIIDTDEVSSNPRLRDALTRESISLRERATTLLS